MSKKSTGRFARVDQRDIHYIDEGTGQPLVLLHGWGFDHSAWRPMIDRLRSRYRVIAVDVRGHGRSQGAASAYRMKDLSSDLFGLLAELNLPKAPVLIGHSLGGSIVQQFAVDHPLVARALVIMDSDLNPPINRLLMGTVTRISSFVMRLAARLLGGKRSLGLYSPLLNVATYSSGWRKAHSDLVMEAAHKFLDNNVPDLTRSLVAWGTRPDLADALVSVSSPTLLIRGSKDLIVTEAKMSALSRALPGARRSVVEGSGHAIISEQPDAVVAMIDSFIREVASAPEWNAIAEIA